MLVEELKSIAQSFDWKFDYGKEYWQNRGDFPEDENLPFEDRNKYLLLLWKDREFIINKYGAIEGVNFQGEMLFVVRSKISDPTYQYKYDTHIKKLEECTKSLFEAFSDCDGWKIKAWKETEVANRFDTCMDGLKINFTIEYSNNG